MSDEPPQFYPDPAMRHEQRYWDGTGWTARVRDGSAEGYDKAPEEALQIKPSEVSSQVGVPPSIHSHNRLIVGCLIAAVVGALLVVAYLWFTSTQF